MFDILIKNGTVIDGSGEAMREFDIGIKGDKIVEIGELHNEQGEIEIDAKEKIVCPGFIDVNNHSDTYWQIFLEPDLDSLIHQGITTIIGGNCGSSLAPLASSKNIESIQKWVDLSKVNVNWLSTKEFFDFLEKKGMTLNFGTLSGHGTMRRGILEDEMRSPNPRELSFIKKKLAVSLEEGSLGMSTGLIYTHARMATVSELTELAEIVRKYGGVYATHIRGEAEELSESIEEAIAVAEKSKVKLHISHLKAVGAKNWPKMEEALATIERMSQNGMEISFDIYPYTSTGSVLYTFLPPWVAEGGRKMMLNRLVDPVIRAKVITEMRESVFEYEKIEIASSSLDKSLNRRNVSEIAVSQNKTVEDAVLDILIASNGRVITSAELLSEGNIRKALQSPLSMIATNGAGYSVAHNDTGEMVHPRSFGTTMKIFSQYVMSEEVLTWEEAVRKMTASPAEKFGIKNRGKIAEGYFADVVVLDRDKISADATNDNPYQYARGVEQLLINGKIILRDGKAEGGRYGRIIKR
ncbi:MAG: D-aminoacylase [Parcubacteria group bacterium]